MSAPTRFKPYPETKDSGIEWLGQIPAHWVVRRLKVVARLESGHTPSRQHPEYWEDCTVPWFGLADVWQIRDDRVEYVSDTNEKVSILGLAHSSARKLPAGTVILSRTASVGFSAIMGTDMATTQDFANWVPDPDITSEYLLYILRAMRPELSRLTMGSTHKTIYMPDIASLVTPVPGVDEQQAIVACIRRETEKIDALVEKKERLIELLQEKRTVLITHAVTKGLDPNVPMKDSGIEWLGQIPAHWEVRRLGYLATVLQTGPFGSQLHSDEYVSGGIPVINPSNIRGGKLLGNKDAAVDEATWARLARHHLQESDIVFSRRGELGRCALVSKREEGWLCGTGCLRACLHQGRASPPFVVRLLSTAAVSEWLCLQSVGSTMDNLNTEIVGRTPICLPPVGEQQNIATFLDRETAKIDALLAKVGEAIERLKEYRIALISAAVTGKIDVRAV